MLTLRRKVAAFAISASLVGGGAGVLAPAASADSIHVHVNNVRVCNNCGDVNINVNLP